MVYSGTCSEETTCSEQVMCHNPVRDFLSEAMTGESSSIIDALLAHAVLVRYLHRLYTNA